MLYWMFKWSLFAPGIRLLWRPTVNGAENVPASGPAVLVANHLSSAETVMLPAMIRRKLIFPAKAEMFSGRGVGPRIVAWFLKAVGMLPMDRSGGRASASSMDGVIGILHSGELLGIFPEGTRSPDGRMYKGKTGVARLVLQAGVPVVPIGFVNTAWTKVVGVPTLRKPIINIGPPLDFTRYAAGANDREVLRWVTDEIMAAVQQQSGQIYVDAYAASVKSATSEGRELSAEVRESPIAGRTAPPLPGSREPLPVTPPPPSEAAAQQTAVDVTGEDVAR